MKLERRTWQILNLLVILVSPIPPIFLAQYANITGPEKLLESNQIFPTNFIPGLTALGDRLSLSMSLDQRPIKNLVSATMLLTNTGKAPILPSDFVENLSINVSKPWSILTVVANDPPVSSNWHRVSDQKFEADPPLINPGDEVRANVYLTNTELDHPSQSEINDIDLGWATHVVNLRKIEVRENIITSESSHVWGAVIYLYGWGLVATIVLSVLFMSEYIYLLYNTIIITNPRYKVIIWIVSVGLLSVAAAESLATYLFPTFIYKIFGTLNWMNIPWIAANFGLLVYLWWRAYREGEILRGMTVASEP
jgi:hypothetical protein